VVPAPPPAPPPPQRGSLALPYSLSARRPRAHPAGVRVRSAGRATAAVRAILQRCAAGGVRHHNHVQAHVHRPLRAHQPAGNQPLIRPSPVTPPSRSPIAAGGAHVVCARAGARTCAPCSEGAYSRQQRGRHTAGSQPASQRGPGFGLGCGGRRVLGRVRQRGDAHVAHDGPHTGAHIVPRPVGIPPNLLAPPELQPLGAHLCARLYVQPSVSFTRMHWPRRPRSC